MPPLGYIHEEDGVREHRIDDSRLQDARKYGEYNAGQRNSEYQPRQVHSTLIPPPPPPPPKLPHPSSTGFHIPSPPPTNTGGVAGLQTDATWSVHAERLDREQEELRDCRDELLGSRFKLAEMRKELRDLHIETTNKDGVAFNLLRQLLSKSATSLPQEIFEAFNEASGLRDQLGILEAKYDAAEGNYNTLEWNYSNKEAKFVEGALSNKLVPIGTVSRSQSADNLHIAKLTHGMTDRTKESRDPWNHTMYCEISDPGSDTFGKTVSDQQGRALGKGEHTSYGDGFQISDHAAVGPIERGIGKLPKKQRDKQWLRKIARIDAWLLEIVADSPLHKIYLKAIHDVGYTDEDEWWENTRRLLTESQEELPLFHTGDSTVSDQTTSKPDIPRNGDASTKDIPTLDITSSTSVASENHPKPQSRMPRSRDLLHASGPDLATLKPPTRSVSGSPVSCMTSEIPSRRTSCTNTADTADTQSDATSQDSDTGGIRLDCTTLLEHMDDAQNDQNRGHFAESTHTTPTRQGQRKSTSSTSDSSHHSDNAYASQSGPAPDSAILTSRLESLPTPPNQFSSPEDCSIASESGTASGDSQTFQREQVFARTEEPSPNVSCIAHTQPEGSGCLVM